VRKDSKNWKSLERKSVLKVNRLSNGSLLKRTLKNSRSLRKNKKSPSHSVDFSYLITSQVIHLRLILKWVELIDVRRLKKKKLTKSRHAKICGLWLIKSKPQKSRIWAQKQTLILRQESHLISKKEARRILGVQFVNCNYLFSYQVILTQ